jgi:hypothetical protein
MLDEQRAKAVVTPLSEDAVRVCAGASREDGRGEPGRRRAAQPTEAAFETGHKLGQLANRSLAAAFRAMMPAVAALRRLVVIQPRPMNMSAV